MLFAPYRLGGLELPNRILMAPMTRNRAGAGGAPVALNADYYAQRAGAGLIITEGTQPSPTGQGDPDTPAAAPRQRWRRLPSRTTRLALLTLLGTVLAAATITPAASAASQRYASPTGTGTTCSSGEPCSITYAVVNAQAGDEVIVAPGDYALPTLNVKSDITVHGVAGKPRPRLLFSGGSFGGLVLNDGSTLRYVELRQEAPIWALQAVHAQVEHVTAIAPHDTVNAKNSVIRNSIFVATAFNGAAFRTLAVGVNNVTLRNVTAIAEASGGVAISAGATGPSGHTNVLARNVIARGGLGGAGFKASTDDPGAITKITVDHSNWAGESTSGTNASIVEGGGNQYAAPGFALAGGYRQAAGSPTIDAGLVEAINGAFDIDGEPRQIDGIDIGADEFNPAPAATTGPAGAVTDHSATLSGTVNPIGADTRYSFEYGHTTSYGSATTDADAGSGGVVAATAAVGGLSPATTYHYRLIAINVRGVAKAADRTFTTAASPTTPPPTASTGAAGAVTDHAATLGGSVNANGAPTTHHFQYGATTAYGNTTPATAAGSGTGTVAAGATLGGLSPTTTYHFRIVATNAGGVTHGADHTFTTAASPTPTPAFAGVKLVSTRLTFARRFITLKLTCPAATVGRCSGRTRLTARRRRTSSRAGSRVTLGRARFSIAAGARATVRVRVSRAGRRRLRGVRRLRGRVRNAAHDAAGQTKTTRARVTIRRRHR